MVGLKPVYLVCGDDDPKIDAWRARVRRRAEDENGPGALEAFDGKLDQLEQALSGVPEGTVLVLVARGKPLARLAKAVEKAGGEQRDYAAPKPWELPRWAAERAAEEGLKLDSEAAKALVASVGTRQQRIAREVERLAVLA